MSVLIGVAFIWSGTRPQYQRRVEAAHAELGMWTSVRRMTFISIVGGAAMIVVGVIGIVVAII